MGQYEHGSKGLCQERAFVSGIQAANALHRSGLISKNNKSNNGKGKESGNVIPVRDDELQVQ